MKPKKIIGITPTERLFNDDNPYGDRYEFLNLYTSKIIDNNAIPIGLLCKDGNISMESLELCDAFIIPGGISITKNVYEVIHYALENHKPILGICMGMQALGIYSLVYDELLRSNLDYEHFYEKYNLLKEQYGENILQKITENNHYPVIVNRNNIDDARHEIIIIDQSSFLFEVYKSTHVSVVSLHNMEIPDVGNLFRVTAINGNVVEGIEYSSNDNLVIGVQFHPEIENESLLIKEFIKRI